MKKFKTEVLSKVKPKELIEEILEPYAESYNILVKKKYVSESNAEKINHYLFWLNKIDNLLPLTRKKNSEAQNYDFDKKKDVYFKGKNGTTTYPLTTQVLVTNEWTVEIVKKRQETLLKAFSDNWNLEYIDEKDKSDEMMEGTSAFFIKNKRGANAEGYKSEDVFVVVANSKLSDEIVSKFEENYPNAYALRNSLIRDGKVVDGILQEDYLFSSISLAASVILGRNAQGQKEWVDALGFTYDQSPINANSSAEFDINDESTYGNVTVGKLAYELIKCVIESGNITNDEIEALKIKDGASSDINSSGYPVLANNREDNKGGSNVTRYRKDPIKHNGVDIFVSFQWKAVDKSKLISWFKKHQG